MDRTEWLKEMRSKAEALYDHGAPRYWVTWGMDDSDSVTHREYLKQFLARVGRPGSAGLPGAILSAACGAGRFDGLLYEAGHSVLGIDQSAGVLAVAREHFPEERFPRLRYEKVGLQEMGQHPAYLAAFDGAICMDAMEHISPEDYPGILRGFHTVLKPGGVLYFTAETLETAVEDGEDLEEAYAKARARGLPVVFGEVVDEFDTAYPQAMSDPDAPGEVYHNAVYRFYPPLEQVRAWIEQTGLVILEEGHGNDVHHFIAQKQGKR
jgi:2-polyprenyl-3-methyl-5-hydroxy-6-metoxy-1,4-benzoquinol methylase